jgi:hypothetical protein
VDVEGKDFEVLLSNDWKKFRPGVIVVECHDFRVDKPKESEIYTFLTKKSYKLHAVVSCSLIFIDLKLDI